MLSTHNQDFISSSQQPLREMLLLFSYSFHFTDQDREV